MAQVLTHLSVAERPILLRAAATGRGRFGLVLVASVAIVGFVGPLVAPHSPTDLAGAPFDSPSSTFLLGTDLLGRDALSRILAGGLAILALAIIATVLGVAAGVVLGLTAGYVKGRIDDVIMRALDVALAFPQIILALLFVSIVGPKLWLICLTVAAIHAPQVARVTRSATLRIAEEDYVQHMEALGAARRTILFGDVLPNVVSPVLVESGLRLTYSIALIAGLSFLGFGLQPPAANWGLMINENRIGLVLNPWPVIIPVVLIGVLTVGMNMFTDAIAHVALGIDRPVGLTVGPVDAVGAVGASPVAPRP